MNKPNFIEGERVLVIPLNLEATVVRQIKHYDRSEEFWGNVKVRFDDGVCGECHCWQLEKLE